MPLESSVQRAIQKFWRKTLKGWVFKVHGNEFTGSGIPDLVGCVPITITKEMVGLTVGIFVALEAKRDEDEEASIIQLQTIEEIKAAHGYSEVVGSVEEAKKHLREARWFQAGSGQLHRQARVMRSHGQVRKNVGHFGIGLLIRAVCRVVSAFGATKLDRLRVC